MFERAEEILVEGKVEFVALAAVTEIDAAVIVWSSLPCFVTKIFCGGLFQRGEFAIEIVGGNIARGAP